MIIFSKVGHTQMFLIELKLFDLLWEKCFWGLWEVCLWNWLNTVIIFHFGGLSSDNLTSLNILGYNRR